MKKQKSRCEFTGCDCLGFSCRKFGVGDCSWNEEVISKARQAVEATGELQKREFERMLDKENSDVVINRALANMQDEKR